LRGPRTLLTRYAPHEGEPVLELVDEVDEPGPVVLREVRPRAAAGRDGTRPGRAVGEAGAGRTLAEAGAGRRALAEAPAIGAVAERRAVLAVAVAAAVGTAAATVGGPAGAEAPTRAATASKPRAHRRRRGEGRGRRRLGLRFFLPLGTRGVEAGPTAPARTPRAWRDVRLGLQLVARERGRCTTSSSHPFAAQRAISGAGACRSVREDVRVGLAPAYRASSASTTSRTCARSSPAGPTGRARAPLDGVHGAARPRRAGSSRRSRGRARRVRRPWRTSAGRSPARRPGSGRPRGRASKSISSATWAFESSLRHPLLHRMERHGQGQRHQTRIDGTFASRRPWGRAAV